MTSIHFIVLTMNRRMFYARMAFINIEGVRTMDLGDFKVRMVARSALQFVATAGGGLLVVALFTTVGCTSRDGAVTLARDHTALRPLTAAERTTDFDAMVTTVRENYGPLLYKEKRFSFQFDNLVAEYRAQAAAAQSDVENFGVLKRFLTRFHDGHVSISEGVEPVSSYTVPLIVMPVEDRVLVAAILEPALSEETGIAVGDELVEVDGRAPLSYLPTILEYDSLGNEVSDQHLIFRVLRRPAFMTSFVPTKPTVALKFVKPGGEVIQRSLVWKVEKGRAYVDRPFTIQETFNSAYSQKAADLIRLTAPATGRISDRVSDRVSGADGSLLQMGSETPFYFSPTIEQTYGWTLVAPSEKYLNAFGLTDLTKAPKLFAAFYRFSGKNILMIRQATYSVDDIAERLAWYKAVLTEYGRLADVLVIDQTHNPGGFLDYAEQFVSLFANQETRGLVNFLRADRRWMNGFGEWSRAEGLKPETKNLVELAFKLVENAYDKGLHLTTTPISFSGSDYIRPAAAGFSFKKPVLLLTDELAGSCGDIVPVLMKTNQLATLFGERTMGLGGNVEPLVQLPHSQATVRMTRGFFTVYSPDGRYDLDNPVENNGVTPDIPYDHTVADVRAGYLEYVKAFSEAAVRLTERSASDPSPAARE